MRGVLMLALVFVSVSSAMADVADPANCACSLDPPLGRECVYLCPDGLGDCPAASFTVTVRNAAGNPINNSVVEILLGGLATNHVRICAGQTVTANTNVSGVVSFNIGGGGCYKGANGAVIRAGGVEIRNYSCVTSSDYTASDNAGIPGRWNLAVGPPDLASFVAAYQGGTGPASCHAYTFSTGTTPAALATFIAAYKGGTNFCNP